MKVIVTGASGRLGAAVCERLRADGIDVSGVDRSLPRKIHTPVQIVDLTHREACYQALQGADVLVHLANHPNQYGKDPQTLLVDNTRINFSVFQAACELGISRWIFASSIQVISRDTLFKDENARCSHPYLPLDEDIPPCPTNPYSLSKQIAEEMIEYFHRTEAIDGVAIRFPWLTGPDRIRQSRGREHYGWARVNDVFSYLLMTDAADLIARLVTMPWDGFRIYVAAAHDTFFGMPMSEVVPRFYPDVPCNIPAADMPGPVHTGRAEADFGWKPTPVTGTADDS